MVVIDTHPEHVSLHPDNVVVPQKWDGSPGDKGLIALIPFLECAFYIYILYTLLSSTSILATGD